MFKSKEIATCMMMALFAIHCAELCAQKVQEFSFPGVRLRNLSGEGGVAASASASRGLKTLFDKSRERDSDSDSFLGVPWTGSNSKGYSKAIMTRYVYAYDLGASSEAMVEKLELFSKFKNNYSNLAIPELPPSGPASGWEKFAGTISIDSSQMGAGRISDDFESAGSSARSSGSITGTLEPAMDYYVKHYKPVLGKRSTLLAKFTLQLPDFDDDIATAYHFGQRIRVGGSEVIVIYVGDNSFIVSGRLLHHTELTYLNPIEYVYEVVGPGETLEFECSEPMLLESSAIVGFNRIPFGLDQFSYVSGAVALDLFGIGHVLSGDYPTSYDFQSNAKLELKYALIDYSPKGIK